jgi:hypothetical protein
MNHRLDYRLRKLEQKQAAELDRDRKIMIMWVTENSSHGPGLWHESELSSEERESLDSLVAEPTPEEVEPQNNQVVPTRSTEHAVVTL